MFLTAYGMNFCYIVDSNSQVLPFTHSCSLSAELQLEAYGMNLYLFNFYVLCKQTYGSNMGPRICCDVNGSSVTHLPRPLLSMKNYGMGT